MDDANRHHLKSPRAGAGNHIKRAPSLGLIGKLFAVLAAGYATYALHEFFFWSTAFCELETSQMLCSLFPSIAANDRTALPVSFETLLWNGIFNCGLWAIFAVQHNIMARSWYKAMLANIGIPELLERPLFVACSGILLQVAIRLWKPMPWGEYIVAGETTKLILWGLTVAGWLGVLYTFIVIDIFALLGVRDALEFSFNFGMRPIFRETDSSLVLMFPFNIVRHPMMSAMLVFYWSSPVWTLSRGLIVGLATVFIFYSVALLEERDLKKHFGKSYEQYCEYVPRFVPSLSCGNAAKSLETKTA